MRYTLQQVKQKIKLGLGHGIVQVELLDDHINEAIQQALDLYDDYFTNFRYSTVSVSDGSTVCELSTIPKTDFISVEQTLGIIPVGATTAVLASLETLDVKAGTVSISIGDIVAIDDHNGLIIGIGVASGTISYNTGEISIVLDAVTTENLTVMVQYKQEPFKVLDVLSVEQTTPEEGNKVLSAYGIYDITGIKMNRLTETAAQYYQTMKSLKDQTNLLGSDLNWEYYAPEKKLFIQANAVGTASVKLAIKPTLADVASENTGNFIKLATAKTKEVLGRVRGKYSGVEVPGGTLDIDGDTLLSEAEREIQEVLEAFNTKRNPAFVVIK